MFLDKFDLKHQSDVKDYNDSKKKRLDGTFKHSYTNERMKSELKLAKEETLKYTQGPISGFNETNFNTYLKDKEDLPRLSILTNYN